MLNVLRKKPDIPEGYNIEKVISIDSERHDLQIGLYLLKPDDNKLDKKRIFTITKGYTIKKLIKQGELTKDSATSLSRINDALSDINDEAMDTFGVYLSDALLSLSNVEKSTGKITINEMSVEEAPKLNWEDYLPF
nr:MAG TPA: hypothetical protein [Caudoviricetes sp.]